MALCSINLPTSVDYTDPEELKKLNSYLFKLSEEIKYMFNNIDPADNFSSESYIAYKQDLDKIASIQVDVDRIKLDYVTASTMAQLQLTVNGISANYVGKNNIVQAINLSSEGIKISGSKIELTADQIKLEGKVTANGNFSIDTAGTMTCRNANITGTIDGSEIKGSTIHSGELTDYSETGVGQHYFFEVGSNGHLYCQYLHFENGGYGASIGAEVMACAGLSCEGSISCNALDAVESVDAPDVYADRLHGGLVSGSDRRIKENIENISEDTAVSIIERLEPVSFRYIKNKTPAIGFIAQDVEEMEKDLGTGLPLFEMYRERYEINYVNYIPLIVKAVQKLLREAK